MSEDDDVRWRANMPPECSWLDDEPATSTCDALEHAAALSDPVAALQAVRRASAVLSGRDVLSVETRARMCEALIDLAMLTNMELTGQSELSMVLHVAWSGDRRKPLRQYGLVVDWRRLWDRLRTEHGRMWIEGPYTLRHRETVSSEHQASLARLMDGARRFFPETATEEILAEFLPMLVPGHESFHLGLGMLLRLLPVNYPAKCVLWIPRLLSELERSDRSDTTATAIFTLLARAARHVPVELFDWSPHLPFMFNMFSRMLDISIDERANPLPADRAWPSHLVFLVPSVGGAVAQLAKSMSRIVVATLSHPRSPTQALLDQLLHAVRTAYHPSNEDFWSLPLCVLLKWCALYFAKRHGRRKRAGLNITDTSETDTKFVHSILDVALLALYSSLDVMVSASESALKYLAYVSPEIVFDALAQEVFPSLGAVTESHRTLSALRTIAAVAVPLLHRRLYRSGATRLQPLLYAALPGIDPNDPNKSATALSFFWAVFCNVPFHDAAEEGSAGDDQDDEAEEEARSATMGLGEWALAFTTKLMDFVMHLESGDSKEQDQADVILFRLLDRASRTFFACLSPALHATCAKKLIEMAVSSLNVNTVKPVGMLLSAAASSSPATFVPMALNELLSRLRSSERSSLAKSELRWCLNLLSASVQRSGEFLLPFVNDIALEANRALEHEDKDVRHCALKLVTNSLRALTQTYPLEYATFPRSWWTKEEHPKHWRWWGRFHELSEDTDDLEVQWHVPSEAELNAAMGLASSVLQEPQAILSELVANTSTSVPPSLKVIHKAVLAIHAVIKGSVVLLGDFDDGECQRSSLLPPSIMPNSCTARAEFPLLSPASRSAIPELGLGQGSLRTRLARLVLGVLSRLSSLESSSPRAWQALVALTLSLLFECGVWSQSYAKLSGLNQFARRQHREYDSGRRCVLRSLLVEQCELIFYCKSELCRARLCLSPVALSLFDALQRLCLHELEVVNSDASDAILRVTSAFPETMDRLVRAGLDALDSDTTTHNQLQGAIGLLLDESLVLTAHCDWQLFERWVLVICRCGRHNDDQVQALLHPLFLRHARYFQTQSLTVPQLSLRSNSNVDVALLPLQTQRLGQFVQVGRAARKHLIEELLKLVAKEHRLASEAKAGRAAVPIHWRYELIAATYLWLLLRDDEPPSRDVAMYFTRCLVSDFSPLRVVALAAVNVILGMFGREPAELCKTTLTDPEEVAKAMAILNDDTIDLEKLEIASESDRLAARFCDSSVSGFANDSLEVCWYESSAEGQEKNDKKENKDPEFLSEMIDFFEANMEKVVGTLLNDHPSLDQQQNEADDDTGTSEDITAFAYVFSCWPRNRFPAYAKDLEVLHTYLIEALIKASSSRSSLIEKLLIETDKLVLKSADIEAQVSAAELVAGIVRGTRHWSYEQTQTVRERCSGYIDVVVERCALESLDSWTDALRLCADEADPRRVIWMLRRLLNVSSMASLQPSQQMRRLRIVSGFVIEFGWRGAALRRVLLQLVREQGAELSVYQQVRDEVGTIMFLLRNLDMHLDEDRLRVLPPSPVLEAAAEHMIASVGLEEGSAVHMLNTALYWMMVSFTYGDMITFERVFIALLPNILAAVQHSKRELAELARYVLEVGAWASYSQPSLIALLTQLETIASSPTSSWHVRRGVLSVLLFVFPRHAFVMPTKAVDGVAELLAKLLFDPQLETRQLASDALSGVVASAGSRVSVQALLTRFTNLAKTPLKNKKRKRSAEDNATTGTGKEQQIPAGNLLRRHAGVLGMAALVRSEPYDCPSWLPVTLQTLSRHMGDPAPIDATVRDCLSMFKRTHQDTWHLLRHRFTEEQLEALSSAYTAPSYFV